MGPSAGSPASAIRHGGTDLQDHQHRHGEDRAPRAPDPGPHQHVEKHDARGMCSVLPTAAGEQPSLSDVMKTTLLDIAALFPIVNPVRKLLSGSYPSS